MDVFSEGLSFTLNNEVIVNFGIVRSDIAKKFSMYAEIRFADFDWD